MFPAVIREIILDYAATWELLDWVDFELLSWEHLAENRNGVDFMIKHPRYTHWGKLSGNENHAAFYHIRANMQCLLNPDDLALSTNEEAVLYACEHIADMDDPSMLSRNPLAIPWLRERLELVSWEMILLNPSYEARDLLSYVGLFDKLLCGLNDDDSKLSPEDQDEKVRNFERDMLNLCKNPSDWAMEIVARNIQHICMLNCKKLCNFYLSRHGLQIADSSLKKLDKQEPSLLERAKTDPDNIYWPIIAANPDAIEFLKDNIHHLPPEFSLNPAIFELKRPDGVLELL